MTNTHLCVVWWAELDDVGDRHAALLDGLERERVARLRQAAERDRATLSAALLRLAVADRLGIAPIHVFVDRRCGQCGLVHGRPRLPGTNLYASTAHSGQRVGVALTEAGPVGIDVEEVTPVDIAALSASVLSPKEAPDVDDLDDFFLVWARKESVLKATGEGLAVPMADIIVGPPHDAPRLDGYPGTLEHPPQMFDLSPGDGHVGALTVLAAGRVSVEELDASDLLDAA